VDPKDEEPIAIVPNGHVRRLDGVRVLVVEDSPDAREMMHEILSFYGADCASVGDVPSAREKLLELSPDVILSDIGLPGEDGYAFLRWLGGQPSPPRAPPVIALTAYDLKDWHAAGFETHLRKPVEIERLVEAILDALKKRKSEPQ